MHALILNSGLGHRMGIMTSEQPKCLTEIGRGETILSRQLRLLADCGIEEAVITTGYRGGQIARYCRELDMPIRISFVDNPLYQSTNYIYSIYRAVKETDILTNDILLLHGDMVFEPSVLDEILTSDKSRMAVCQNAPLSDKDFKAVLEGDSIKKIGVEFFSRAVAAYPLYKLEKSDWKIWAEKITAYCEDGKPEHRSCYAEVAFNEASGEMALRPFDIGKRLCQEIDTPDDLATVISGLERIRRRTVYMSFGTDIIHSAHLSIIKKAARLGKLIIGCLSDEAIASYRRFPLLPYAERKALLEGIGCVHRVVEQKELSYRENLLALKPDYVVHGDDWREGFQQPLRAEVAEVLATYGGQLVEYPYSREKLYEELESRARLELSLPDFRRARLKKAIAMKGLVTVIEAHNGLTGLLAEKTVVQEKGKAYQFDAMWSSSLCDSTSMGKPDIELVDSSTRFQILNEIMEVTTKPIIYDGDTGGKAEHFVYTVKTLERMGVSAIIIEDKIGLKKNSLFGTEVAQTQDTLEHFSEKLKAGKAAQRSTDFMIIARIESLILEKGMEDALKRAFAYVEAGADGIMIHSRKKDPAEIFAFTKAFRAKDKKTPLVVVPTSFNTVTEDEFKQSGVNIVIYANQLTRSAFPAMKETAEEILRCHRAKECDDRLLPIKEIITLIPE